jgi:hypothetical protein
LVLTKSFCTLAPNLKGTRLNLVKLFSKSHRIGGFGGLIGSSQKSFKVFYPDLTLKLVIEKGKSALTPIFRENILDL